MKTTLTLALIGAGWIGLVANTQSVAQYGPSAPVAGQPAASMAQDASATQEFSNSPVPAPSVQAANGVPMAMPGATFDVPPDDSLLIDNGLWDGAPVGACCAICGGGSGCPPDWYTEQGVRLLGRTRPREVVIGAEPIGFVQNTPLFEAQLTNRSAAPDVSVAYATTIGHYFARDTLNRDHFVEFSFWGLNGWKDEAHVTASNTFTRFLPVVPGQTTDTQFANLVSAYNSTSSGQIFMRGFDGAEEQRTYYSSYNQNFEINGRISPRSRNDRLVLHSNGKWRRECQPGTYMSYLYGVRYMQVHEAFNFHSRSVAIPLDNNGIPDYGNPTLYEGDYGITTHNNLMGLQVGADMMFRQCRWAWGVRSKVGAFINFSDQTSNIVSPDLTRSANNPLGANELSAAKHEAALIGEVGFTATYKFRPNLMGRAGYDFMWVTGLALAPEQLQFVPSPVDKVNTNGSIFYHGLSLGLEWMW